VVLVADLFPRSATSSLKDVRWIPRHCFAWLLIAQFTVIAPHMQRLPIVLVLSYVVAVVWRVMIFQGRWYFPNLLIKIGLVAICIASIRSGYSNWIGLEPSVALLITCFSFKLLESSTRRDAYLLLFLGYFVTLTEFLFEQGLGVTLYMLIPTVLLTTALLALHQSEPLRFNWQPLRTAVTMATQAVPLMLLLFLVFPRFAPLWQVPLPGTQARTGMSDEIGPGDIAKLSQSDELAFRAEFEGATPVNAKLYWRGLVMDDFDGRRWHVGEFSDLPVSQVRAQQRAQVKLNSADENQIDDDASIQTNADPSVSYRIYLEPTYQRWLYALETPEPLDRNIDLTWDYRLLARDIVHEKITYRARANTKSMDLKLDPRLRQRTLELPDDNNPRTVQWAHDLRAQVRTAADYVDAVINYFHTQPFYYTLQPPVLGDESVDEFLFDVRRGFCEHYASSFVFAMRAGGVPARVVAGYQGGERNPLSGTVLVHQFDAHAWAEVWLRGKGWVRVDPTAAVAPSRIESGIESAVKPGEFLAQSPFSANRYRGVNWLNTVRMRIDVINYNWTRWVVNYREDTQTGVLKALLGDVSAVRLALLLVGGGAVALAVVAFFLLGKPTRVNEAIEVRLYRKFLQQMARRGYPCEAGMAPADYARWLQNKKPQWQTVGPIVNCFSDLSYRPLNAAQRKELLRKLRRLIFQLRYRSSF